MRGRKSDLSPFGRQDSPTFRFLPLWFLWAVPAVFAQSHKAPAVALVLPQLSAFGKAITGEGAIVVEGEFSVKLHGMHHKKTQRGKFSTVASFRRGGRISVRYDPFITPWTNGAAPYFEQVKTLSYNGSYLIEAVERSGPEGKAVQYRRATIHADRSGFTTWGYETGMAPFLAQWRVLGIYNFADALMAAADRKGLVELSIDDLDAELILRFSAGALGRGQAEDILVFDKTKAYALKSAVQRLDMAEGREPGVKAEMQNSGFQKFEGADLYYPTECLMTLTNHGSLLCESQTTLKSCRYLNGDDKSNYDVTLEPGWYVTDERIGHSFTIGEATESVVERIKESVGERSPKR